MVEIKQERNSAEIGFNNSAVPLQFRSPEDLLDLAILALESGDPGLLDLFEPLPPLKKLKAAKMGTLEVPAEVTPVPASTNQPDTKSNEGKAGKTTNGRNARQQAAERS